MSPTWLRGRRRSWCRDVTEGVRRHPGAAGREPERGAGRDRRPRGPQRLGQDDAHQRHQRPLRRPIGGRIELGDVTLSTRPAHEIAGLGVSRTYQIPRPFAHLTALDNVAVAATFGAARRSPGQARAEARRWLEFTGLSRRAAALPSELNLHERKFLELARALAGQPRVILLDEVLSGLNPGEIASAIGLIRQIQRARRRHPLRRAPDARGARAVRPARGPERGRGDRQRQPARGDARLPCHRGLSGQEPMLLEAHGTCRSPTAMPPRCGTPRCRWPPARSSPSSAPTARARARW